MKIVNRIDDCAEGLIILLLLEKERNKYTHTHTAPLIPALCPSTKHLASVLLPRVTICGRQTLCDLLSSVYIFV